ncbi:uncharacterized protein LOC121380766 isoform X2 [Gigantopelta aegis]|uniref:uncharacterized protein LOC121380766 isoform X2 n=1 Tax=Gigantopelta aegis TaxID=1735272 RepID=UPI001B889974|nr:uncharacterized protein LOC121380766 isoform X2 [Gigantopelta aegis]
MSEVSTAVRVKRIRSRKSNYSDNEIAIMVDEVAANYSTLFSSVPSSNLKMKNDIWNSIAQKINASTGTGVDRSGKEIRKKWNYFKCYVKKKTLLNIRSKKMTRGGPTPSACALTRTEKKVLSLIPICQIETDGELETDMSDECSTMIDETGCSGADGPVSPNFPRDVSEPESSVAQFIPRPLTQPVKEESVLQSTVNIVSRVGVETRKLAVLKQLLDVEKTRLCVERSRLAIEERRLLLEEEKLSLMKTSITSSALQDPSLN